MFFGIIYATLPDPPIEDMIALNAAAISNLQNAYLSQLPHHTPDFNDPIEAAGAALIKLDPAVDSSISSSRPPKTIWVWAEKHADTVSAVVTNSQGCQDSYFLKFVSKFVSFPIKFSFRGSTRTTQDPDSFYFDIPFSKNELDAADPYDRLSVDLTGKFDFYYDRLINYYSKSCSDTDQGEVCICVPSATVEDVKVYSKPFSSTLSYEVEAGNVLFLMNAPLLREQWFRNDKFNNIALSKRIFYKSDIIRNQEKVASASIYEFDYFADKLGIHYIKSLLIADPQFKDGITAFKEDKALVFPKQLEEKDEKFGYVYQTNFTYSGIEKNDLELDMHDRFLNVFEKKELINSRLLSYEKDGVEDNLNLESVPEKINPESIRPSLAIPEQNTNFAILEIGLIFVFIIILLKRF